MSSSTMHEAFAIHLQNVSKIYKLHGSQTDQLIDVLGLQRFGLKTKTIPKEFAALSDISLDVPRGHRIGVVGRNGAGKTTLLKLICGNFAPTSGEVEVNGTVQALMNIGLGFHPEYTGRENVEASLQYNGLASDKYQKAMEEIIEFCELDDFLDQPFKTYSLGMQGRLMFAAATAISPDILIVDEVLGAGDAYFVAKSKKRVQALVGSGCAMLLVSHSMQQVLELCEEAIWIDQGKILAQGKSLEVVKEYERFINKPISLITGKGLNKTEQALDDGTRKGAPSKRDYEGSSAPMHYQDPEFVPHQAKCTLGWPEIGQDSFKFGTVGGVSRWESDSNVRVVGATILTDRGETNKLFALEQVKICIAVQAKEGAFEETIRYGLAVFNAKAEPVIRITSKPSDLCLASGEIKNIGVTLNPIQLGAGDYTLSISILENTSLQDANSAQLYDVISRSIGFSVDTPGEISVLAANFFHSAEWTFE